MAPSNDNHPSPLITRAIPNERWEIILEFTSREHRIFKASIARKEKEFSFLAHPQPFKAFTFTHTDIFWDETHQLSAAYLHEKSDPISRERLTAQYLILGSKNRAPTSEHPTHHVYIVGIRPFDKQTPFSIGESIGGGHTDTGGSRAYSLEQLLKKDNWAADFKQADCTWAIPIIQAFPKTGKRIEFLLDELVVQLQQQCKSQ